MMMMMMTTTTTYHHNAAEHRASTRILHITIFLASTHTERIIFMRISFLWDVTQGQCGDSLDILLHEVEVIAAKILLRCRYQMTFARQRIPLIYLHWVQVLQFRNYTSCQRLFWQTYGCPLKFSCLCCLCVERYLNYRLPPPARNTIKCEDHGRHYTQ
jgi:hypothetical protein